MDTKICDLGDVSCVIVQFAFSNAKIVPASVETVPDKEFEGQEGGESRTILREPIPHVSLSILPDMLVRRGLKFKTSSHRIRQGERGEYQVVRYVFANDGQSFLPKDSSRLFVLSHWQLKAFLNSRKTGKFLSLNLAVREPVELGSIPHGVVGIDSDLLIVRSQNK